MTPKMPLDDTLATVDDALRYLRTSRSTLYRLAAEGKLTPVKLRRRSLYRKADLDAFAASLTQRVAA